MEVELESSPRISFSSDILDDDEDFICITPISPALFEYQTEKASPQYTDFEFLLDSLTCQNTAAATTTTADQLFFDGKLLPFSNQALTNIRLKEEKKSAEEEERENKQNRIVWTCVDEDPSPKPPTCTLLWKELLRIKKHQRASSSSSSSSSSSLSPSRSSSSCSSIVIGDLPRIEEGKEEPGNIEKHIKWLKKGLEKTRRSTSTTRIRPMSNVPTPPSISSPPLFPLLLKKVKVLER